MSFSRKLFYSLPPAWRFAARRLYYLPLDTWEALSGQRDGLIPPKGMSYTGSGDFRRSGGPLVLSSSFVACSHTTTCLTSAAALGALPFR
ncbi:MAG: hypothetical protein IPN76_02520 [Saprospiraceae bacterium]|nr:hypothetical protein [Saprospiraceae bacterium]